MKMCYKKLWKLLIEKDLKKKDLQALAGISSASITKMGKNENINTDILVKICNALKCDVADIMEYVPEENVEPEVAVNGTARETGHNRCC